ncbi:hypothetical protein X801_09110 [Opisthorchis viverrini]|uniref:Sugar phosphate phosphatase n=1 Tax=Opisthorchis viverrini TaxID=6198 RepID=A0A1S8WKX3_OPIVI|nr:hypothetical protein X801_09110 [Opisthorchis viverrini]
MDELAPRLDFKHSAFARHTIRHRWPVILAQLIDSVYRNRVRYQEDEGIDPEKLKSLTGCIGQLRYEVTTDKPITLLSSVLPNFSEELEVWNSRLHAIGVKLTGKDDLKGATSQHPSWHSLPWLFTECYLYRRIMDHVFHHGLLSFDPFAAKKHSGLKGSVALLEQLLRFLSLLEDTCGYTSDEEIFETFFQAALWANEFDLSLHAKEEHHVGGTSDLPTHIRRMLERMVVNDTHELWRFWTNRMKGPSSVSFKQEHITSIVLDNAGPELVADLCLAEFLIRSQLTSKVVFYPKCIPWFVSDVTAADVDWLLKVGLSTEFLPGPIGVLAHTWACRWTERFKSGEFIVRNSTFWTLPCDFAELAANERTLCDALTQSDVVVFKGDLNYRKLVGDRSWTPDNPQHKLNAFRAMQLGRAVSSDGLIDCKCTPVSEIRSDSCKHPLGAPVDCRCHNEDSPSSPPLVIALRVAKADVAVGLSPEMLRKVTTESSDWWTLGRYGFVQLISPLYFG